jgi:hypothetical protein
LLKGQLAKQRTNSRVSFGIFSGYSATLIVRAPRFQL